MSELSISVQQVGGEARISSKVLAERLGNQHKNVMSLVSDYQAEFEGFGILAFETEEIKGRGQPAKFALLNENQCYFLLTLTRNSEQVVALKVALVHAFSQARRAPAPAPALPTDPVELLALSVAGLQQHRQQIAAIEQRLDHAPIRMHSEKRANVYRLCQEFGRVHPKGYGGAYRAFKEAFGYGATALAAYDDLPSSRYEEALNWLNVQITTYGQQRLEWPA